MPPAIAAMHDSYMIRYVKTGEKRLIGVPRKLIMKHKSGADIPCEVSLGEVPQHQQDGKCKFIAIFRTLSQQPEKISSLKDCEQVMNYSKKEIQVSIIQCCGLISRGN
jgi:two-component system sensor kinase FixL